MRLQPAETAIGQSFAFDFGENHSGFLTLLTVIFGKF